MISKEEAAQREAELQKLIDEEQLQEDAVFQDLSETTGLSTQTIKRINENIDDDRAFYVLGAAAATNSLLKAFANSIISDEAQFSDIDSFSEDEVDEEYDEYYGYDEDDEDEEYEEGDDDEEDDEYVDDDDDEEDDEYVDDEEDDGYVKYNNAEKYPDEKFYKEDLSDNIPKSNASVYNDNLVESNTETTAGFYNKGKVGFGNNNYDYDNDPKWHQIIKGRTTIRPYEYRKSKGFFGKFSDSIKNSLSGIISNPKAVIGISSYDCINKNYIDVVKHLMAHGFTNIQSHPANDLGFSQLSLEGHVLAISIEKDLTFSSQSEYCLNSPIDIVYHSSRILIPPLSSKEVKGKNIYNIHRAFENSGFEIIIEEPVFDLIVGILKKNGSVEKVLINHNDYTVDQTFRVDATVTVTYHTFKKS